MTRRTPLLLAALLLGGCQSVADFEDPLAPDIVQEAGLGDAMLNSGDPDSAVSYFERAAAASPDNPELQRSLAQSYMRTGRLAEAEAVLERLEALGADTPQDRVERAFIALRLEQWENASAMGAALPPDHDTARRALLDALLADRAQDWAAADVAYARAVVGAGEPAAILNNWGVSRMARGDLDAAAATFARALAADPKLFAAKNNLAIARALGGAYSLPEGEMNDEERAVLFHNMGLVALRRGERATAKRLFERAVAIHPQHYRSAADRLAAL